MVTERLAITLTMPLCTFLYSDTFKLSTLDGLLMEYGQVPQSLLSSGRAYWMELGHHSVNKLSIVLCRMEMKDTSNWAAGCF
jgi:hypothetical protein